MEKKAKLGMSALLLIGAVYAVLGGVFVVLGTALLICLGEQDVRLVGVVFSGIGSVFLLLGILFLTIEGGKKRRANKLLAGGRYVWGEIVELVPNFNVRINNRHPYIAVVRYRDIYGVEHIFRSTNLRIYPDPALTGRKVKVYVRDERYKPYYVDMDEVLMRYVEH